MRTALRLTCLALCFIAAGCSGVFFIKSLGNIDHAYFAFYDHVDSRHASKVKISEVIVERKVPDTADSWVVVWRLRGTAATETLVYGVVPPGLSEDAAAIPLVQRSRYRIYARESPKANPPRRASAVFEVTANGDIVSMDENR